MNDIPNPDKDNEAIKEHLSTVLKKSYAINRVIGIVTTTFLIIGISELLWSYRPTPQSGRSNVKFVTSKPTIDSSSDWNLTKHPGVGTPTIAAESSRPKAKKQHKYLPTQIILNLHSRSSDTTTPVGNSLRGDLAQRGYKGERGYIGFGDSIREVNYRLRVENVILKLTIDSLKAKLDSLTLIK